MTRELGCYGLASTVNPDSQACKRCPAAQGCITSARAVVNAVRNTIDVSGLLATLVQQYAIVGPMPARTAVEAAPAKVRPRLRRLLEGGFVARAADDLGRRRNPFPNDKDIGMHLAGELLIAGHLDRQVLRHQLEERGWSYQAAASQVSNTLALLRGMQLVEQQGRGFVISSQIQPIAMNP